MSTPSHKIASITESISTWEPASASDNNWNNADNWQPNTPPTDNVRFHHSLSTAIGFTETGASVEAISFSEDAPAYTFKFTETDTTPALTITGEGIKNHSTVEQRFVVAANGVSYKEPQLKFTNEASAGGENVTYSVGPGPISSATPPTSGFGGGIIAFVDQADAGSAAFTVTTGATPPPKFPFKSTVGGEVSFSHSSSAKNAQFTIFGSTSTTDGDTFGNVVFHNTATADKATFINKGGTQTFKNQSGEITGGGDGGNTQFYGDSSAANAVFDNEGATVTHANGGDVAFDASSSAGKATFNNHPARVNGGYGGVTSFNNNAPKTAANGASAGYALIHNYGAHKDAQGGGGHTEFSARYGNPSADHAKVHNYGSEIVGPKSKYGNAGLAGHTIFSISLPTDYYPTAGNATFYNHPGTIEDAPAGYTEFSVYGKGNKADQHFPCADRATFINLGANKKGANGGYTSFTGSSSADHASLIACSGTHGGKGGKIAFYDNSKGDNASVQLLGNGMLDISEHRGELSISDLSVASSKANISSQLGTDTTKLILTSKLHIQSDEKLSFSFWMEKGEKVQTETNYSVLTAPNISDFDKTSFRGTLYEKSDTSDGYTEKTAHFTIQDGQLHVYFL